MERFRSASHTQRLLAASGSTASRLRPRRHLCSAPESRQETAQRFQTWQEMTGTAVAASQPSEVSLSRLDTCSSPQQKLT